MRRIIAIAGVPGHFDRGGAKVDGSRNDFHSRVVLQYAVNQTRKRCAIVCHCIDFRDREKTCYRQINFSLALLLG
jgi:hypothetical protein